MIKGRKTYPFRDIGLLILRAGIGIMFILHGYPKVFGGPEKWIEVGQTIQYIGINFAPMFFGFVAGIAELFGGIFLLLGLFFSPGIILLLIVMIVATAKHIGEGAGFTDISHSITMGIVLFSMLFIGAGKHSIDSKLNRRRRRRY